MRPSQTSHSLEGILPDLNHTGSGERERACSTALDGSRSHVLWLAELPYSLRLYHLAQYLAREVDESKIGPQTPWGYLLILFSDSLV